MFLTNSGTYQNLLIKPAQKPVKTHLISPARNFQKALGVKSFFTTPKSHFCHYFSNSTNNKSCFYAGSWGMNYPFGYQGSEKDNEISGEGNAYTTYFRELDVRLGRWFAIDPKTSLNPWESPYVSMGVNPIVNIDILGDYVGYKKLGDFLRVQFKCIFNRDFRETHQSRKADKENTFIYDKKNGKYPPLADAVPQNYPKSGTPHDGSKKNSMKYPIYYKPNFAIPIPNIDMPDLKLDFTEIVLCEEKEVERSKTYKILPNAQGATYNLKRLVPNRDVTFTARGKIDNFDIVSEDNSNLNFNLVYNTKNQYPDEIINAPSFSINNSSTKLTISVTSVNPETFRDGTSRNGPSPSSGTITYWRYIGFNFSIFLPRISLTK